VNPEDAVDLVREALKACMIVGGPIVILGLVVGLAVGLLQAMTQVQDQTVSFVPKILVMILGIGIALPWLSDKMVDYTRGALEKPMIYLPRATGSFDTQPSWERPGYFQPEQPLNHEIETDKDDRLASPLRAKNGSRMPRLSQNYSMPQMKLETPGSMPMLKSPAQSPFQLPAPRVAEKPDPDF
jgi:flagellar biosynthetic protein FliQ